MHISQEVFNILTKTKHCGNWQHEKNAIHQRH